VKIRDLTRQAGSDTISAWPPRWAGSFEPADTWDTMPRPGEGVLESVMVLVLLMLLEDATTLLRLTMTFEAREYMGILRWDPPPALAAVESLLKANLGRKIQAIGELDISNVD
jgi:hypothetical protein